MLLRADTLTALALTLGVGLIVRGDSAHGDAGTAEAPIAVSYAQQIAPILAARCVECHGNESAELGLNMETYEGLMAGSDYGTVVEPGNPTGSLILDMIESGDMPQDGDPMPPEELELIRTWIAEGALNN